MTISEIACICLAFFVLGLIITLIGLAKCRLKTVFRRRRKHFSSLVPYTPNLNLELQQRTKSIDDSTALDEFKQTRG